MQRTVDRRLVYRLNTKQSNPSHHLAQEIKLDANPMLSYIACQFPTPLPVRIHDVLNCRRMDWLILRGYILLIRYKLVRTHTPPQSVGIAFNAEYAMFTFNGKWRIRIVDCINYWWVCSQTQTCGNITCIILRMYWKSNRYTRMWDSADFPRNSVSL